jgi:tape measure domain-containing protein
MAVNVEYIIKLRDKFSAQVKKANSEADKLNGKVNNINKSFAGLGSTIARIGGAIAVGSLVKEVASLGIQMEQTRVSFTTFLGGTEEAAKGADVLIGQLNEFANVTPFTNDQVIKAGKSLLAFGTSANEIQPTLKNIGDIAAGTGKDFNELATIYGKAKIAGTLYAEDINQLVEAGIPIMGEFAKILGVQESQVKKLASEGKLSFGALEQSFQNLTSEGGLFFDLMQKQSETVGGRISTLVGKLQTIGIIIGEALLPAIGVFADFALSVVQGGEALGDLIIVLGAVATGYVAMNFAALKAAAITKIFTAGQWLLNAALTANPIGLVVAGIAALIAVIALAWRHSETFRGVVLGLWEVLKTMGENLWQMIIEPLKAYFQVLKSIFTLDLDGLLEGLKKLGRGILSFVLQPILQLAKVVDKITGTNFAAKIQQFTGIKDLTAGAGEAFGKGFAKGAEKEEKTKTLTQDTSILNKLSTKATAGGAGTTAGAGVDAGISGIKSAAPKTFNINIEKLVEDLNVNTTNLTESAARIKEEVQKALLTAITDVSIVSE